jgi:hypothetical protein
MLMAKKKTTSKKGKIPPSMPRKKPEQDVGGGAVPPSMPQKPKPKKNTNKSD